MSSLALLLVFLVPGDGTAPGAFIDRRIAAKAEAAGAAIAPRSDDAGFLRRVTLDLHGVVPRPEEVRAFLGDPSPDKRVRAIDRLLCEPAFDDWHARWLVETLTERRAVFDGYSNQFELQEWLCKRLEERTPYDELARAILTASGQFNVNGAVNWVLRYQGRPADLAGAMAKGMLGSSLRCAQCHDHKFLPMTQKKFWGVAAFFARTQLYYLGNGEFGVTDSRFGRLAMPFGGDPDAPPPPEAAPPALAVAPRWLDGTRAHSEDDLRGQLADFVTRDPLFSRNLVNRLWARHFGRGLVEPLDDTTGSTPSHPELLEELSRFAIEVRYDLRAIVREIVLSQTYQRAAAPAAPGDERLFGRALLRPLGVDQLFRSIVRATGLNQDEDDSDALAAAEIAAEQARLDGAVQPPAQQDAASAGTMEAAAPGSAAMKRPALADDGSMLELSDSAQTAREALYFADLQPLDFCGGAPGTLPHALARLNAPEMHAACDSAARLALKLFGPPAGERHVEWMWLSLLSRPPTPAELARADAFLAASQRKRKALHDLCWVLLNSQEFTHNH
jgi:hypothetical protein